VVKNVKKCKGKKRGNQKTGSVSTTGEGLLTQSSEWQEGDGTTNVWEINPSNEDRERKKRTVERGQEGAQGGDFS